MSLNLAGVTGSKETLCLLFVDCLEKTMESTSSLQWVSLKIKATFMNRKFRNSVLIIFIYPNCKANVSIFKVFSVM